MAPHIHSLVVQLEQRPAYLPLCVEVDAVAMQNEFIVNQKSGGQQQMSNEGLVLFLGRNFNISYVRSVADISLFFIFLVLT